MKKVNLTLVLFLFSSWLNLNMMQAQAQREQVLDRIVAVVGDEIILESELKTQVQLYADQYRQSAVNLDNLDSIILNQMIKDKLILIQAEKDTSIKVSSQQVEEALDEQLKRLKANFATEEQFQQQLQKEGITQKDLKKRYKVAIHNQLLKDKLLSSKISKISVSSKEVKDFYYSYSDSLQEQPEGIRLAHILILIKPSTETIDQLKRKAEWTLERLREGGDFSELAKNYSDDPSSLQGGELGYFKRGDMVPPFEKAAFALNPGEISDVVETQFGFHIIKLEDKRDDMVKAKHILIMLVPSAQDSLKSMELTEELHSRLEGGADFPELAKIYSSDEESKKMGGDLGWYTVESLSPEFKQATEGLKVGQISQPLLSQFGIHLLKVIDRQESKKLTLEGDWDTIKDMVKKQKASYEIEEWIDKLMQETYLEVKL